MEGLFYDEHCDVSGARLPGTGASMTLGEAEAWRAGWRAAIEAAAAACADERATCWTSVEAESRRVLDKVAAAIRALPVPDGGQ